VCVFSPYEFEGFSHGCLDIDRLYVLPSLFEEGDQEVDSHEDVLSELVLVHAFVSDGDGHAGDLLQLELDVGSGVVDLSSQGFGVGDNLREHTDSVEDGSQDSRDLLDEGVGGEEYVVLFGPLLDWLLLLVEFLESFKIDDVDVEALCFLKMFGISDQADLELGSGDMGKSDGTGESLIFLGVVILKSDLEFHGLNELSLLLVLENGGNAFSNLGLGKSAHIFLEPSKNIYI
jgi:hypothetical protein